jgi:TRAP-type C4-dicarboxylate transport system permease small subunit
MRWLARWGLLIGGAALLVAGGIALIVVEGRSAPVTVGLGAPSPEGQTGLGIATSLIVVGFVAILIWFVIRYGRRR